MFAHLKYVIFAFLLGLQGQLFYCAFGTEHEEVLWLLTQKGREEPNVHKDLNGCFAMHPIGYN